METAGRAVVFSGTTVAIGLLALVALPVPFLRSIGFGGMLIPLVSVAVTITLLPVVLATIGPRLDWPRFRRGDKPVTSGSGGRNSSSRRRASGARWRRPSCCLVDPGVLRSNLLLRRIARSRKTTPTWCSTRRTCRQRSLTTPFEMLVSGVTIRSRDRSADNNRGSRGGVAPDGADWQREPAIVLVMLDRRREFRRGSRTTLERVRDAVGSLDGQLGGGRNGGDADFIDAVYGNFRTMLVLILVRHLHPPGACVSVIALAPEGGDSELVSRRRGLRCPGSVLARRSRVEPDLGIEATGAIPYWLPLMIFSFLFGLSMDYEVFILARMREEYDATGSTSTAIVRG